MKKFICKVFGHRYRYFLSVHDTPSRKYRVCLRCGVMEELTDAYDPAYKKAWFALVQYTKFGAKSELGKYYE